MKGAWSVPVGTTRHALSLIRTISFGALGLSGCTSPSTAPIPAASMAEGSAEVGAAPNEAMIFEVQKSQVEGSATLGSVLRQYSGTGPATIPIGRLPDGQKRLGATVICSWTGDWKVRIVQNGPGWGSGGCSLVGGNSITLSLG